MPAVADTQSTSQHFSVTCAGTELIVAAQTTILVLDFSLTVAFVLIIIRPRALAFIF